MEMRKPTLRDRIKSSAEQVARDVIHESPPVVKMREQMQRHITRAATTGLRGLTGRGR
jgi:hypothetical protein